MALFDKLSAMGKAAADKASDAAEFAKYKGKISFAEADIKNVYTEIGKKIIEEYGDIAAEKFGDQLAKINGLKADIEGYKAQLANLKGAAEDVAAEVEEAVPAETPAE